jgi:tetratricopeptide (TPR) repeat protein
MYKSRLHSWGLDKKKKEHEMLEVVRLGMQQRGENQDKVFMIRGRTVTLADALHYFNRKGIKDPTTLLDRANDGDVMDAELSSPEDGDAKTPVSAASDSMEGLRRTAADIDGYPSPPERHIRPPTSIPLTLTYKPTDFAQRKLVSLQAALNMSEIRPMPAFRTLSVESIVAASGASPNEVRSIEGIYKQLQSHYSDIFAARNLSVVNASWTATSDDDDADRFYYQMYQGYSHLWNGQEEQAFELFFAASALIEKLIRENHVAFLVYVLDLVIRHDGSDYEDPLKMILQHVADMALTVSGSETQPIYQVALYLKSAPTGHGATLAEGAMRKLLDFFQDSIGYFHAETIALLQTFATSLLNRKRYAEAAVRFQQLVDAFETTLGKRCYEVCYALRSTSEVYFHMEQYVESLEALNMALERSRGLEEQEEREIYVRCLRGMAEIFLKLGRKSEAVETMQYVVACTEEAFGTDHPFTHRAKMHLKTTEKGDSDVVSSIPLMVYRLGRGGKAAQRNLWVARTSPTRLAP